MSKASALMLISVVYVACATDEPASDLTPEGGAPAKADGFCPIVDANIPTIGAPPHLCGAVDAYNNALMTGVNKFWSLSATVCGCGPDNPAGCDAALASVGGWIFVNQAFIADLARSGSHIPAAYVYAHEFGHEIQGAYGILPAITLHKELAADCFAGYYLGSLVCEGRVNQVDVTSTLETACVIADGTGDPVADLHTHGTCRQRVSAVARGIEAYLRGASAIATCADLRM
jgi:Putative neutral zinc metallopeptidase